MQNADQPIPFPIKGVFVSGPISQQPPGTTTDAQNVRAFDPRTDRNRGASRAGLERFCPDQLAAKSVQEIFHAVQVYGNASATGQGDIFVPLASTFSSYDVSGDPIYEGHPSSPSPSHGTFDQDGNLYTTHAGQNGLEVKKFAGFDPAMLLAGAGFLGQGRGLPNVPGPGQAIANFAANAIANDPRVVDIANLDEGNLNAAASHTITNVSVKSNEILVVAVARHSGFDLGHTLLFAGEAMIETERQDNGDFRTSLWSLKPAADLSGALVLSNTHVSGSVAAIAFKIIQLASSASDVTADDSGSSTTPNSTGAGATTVAKEVVVGVVGTRGPSTDDAGTWGASLLAHQRAGTEGGVATSNVTVATAYRIVYQTGTYTASKSGITSRDWCAICTTFK